MEGILWFVVVVGVSEAWAPSSHGRVKGIRRAQESLEAEVAAAVGALGTTSYSEVERSLVALWSRDARRMDMPPALRDGFVRLFEYRRDRDVLDPSACDALAAIHADHEKWDAAAAACEEATRRGGTSDFRRALWLRARRSVWDWRDGDAAEARELCERDAVTPFATLSLPGVSSEARLARGRRALRAALAAPAVRRGEVSVRTGGSSRPGGLPLVAVLTPDANGAHPLSQLLPSALGAVRSFRIALVTLCAPDGSAERSRFEAGADLVLEAHAASPAVVAGAVADLSPAALVDMCGFAGSADVLEVVARRPAPVVVAGGLGTPHFMGGVVYDWALCDRVVAPDPPRDAETALRVPRAYFCADLSAYEAAACAEPRGDDRAAAAAHGLREAAVVLCCMNRARKVEPEILDAWLGALRELVDDGIDAQLWLYAPSETAASRAIDRAAGVLRGGAAEARDRLVFADRVPRSAHLSRLARADVALDTRVYGSHTLACDYAYAGVPLVTALEGDHWPSRVAAAVNRAAVVSADDREALVAACEAGDWRGAYAAKIVALARDPDLRGRLSRALRDGVRNGAPLWDARRWADGFERALTAALAARSAKAPIDVPPLLPRASCCVVLGSNPDRVRHFRVAIATALPEIQRLDAVEGSDRRAVNDALALLGGLRVAPVFRAATTGQIACVASHALAWTRVAAEAREGYAVILEDDATFPLGGDAFRAAVDDVASSDLGDLCYLYVYPDHWPEPPLTATTPGRPVATRPGFRTWCLLAYLLSRAGARKLLDLLTDQREIYAPVDCMVADWAERGLLDVRAVDAIGFVDNAGQLDRRPPSPGKLRSNLWGAPLWSSPSQR
ncbi:hypothetical protein CTAYLR_000257 [Chrysophaeum taylorii]|uniref:Uncharacterized protein n=1 Tax=Chrysophaeum taylorii TaxID=2483200 RepID=A0AAD7UEH7_9STRA|nr:hypothetical protein CTAYLR_000257 [Chrysophaeum taylorii]